MANIKTGEVPTLRLPVKTKPFNHQVKAYAIATKLDASAMLMEQGTGKTLVAIATVGQRYLNKEINKVLIVAPLSVLPVWENQFKTHADFDYELTVLNKGSTLDKAKIVNQKSKKLKVLVVNYDSLWREPLLSAIEKYCKSAMVILDESQRIKNKGTEASKALRGIGKIAPYKMILTGTPVTQSPLDFFSQYRFLDLEIFGNNYSRFKDKYAVMGGYLNYQVVGYKNLEELAAKAHSIAFRCTKAECLDLPPTIDQNVYAYLNDSKDIYDKMERDFIVALDDSYIKAPVILTQLLRLQQITGGFLPIHNDVGDKIIRYEPVGNEKLNLLKEVLEDTPGKVVIFCRFKPEIRAIENLIFSMGRAALTLSGDTPADHRGRIVDMFQNDKEVDAIVVQIQTGGSGIDLYAAATTIVYSPDFSLANYLQCRARTHRIGQHADKVNYIHLICKDTIDEKILTAVQKKEDVAQYVVDELKGKY